jgi:hypothetical protein
VAIALEKTLLDIIVDRETDRLDLHADYLRRYALSL